MGTFSRNNMQLYQIKQAIIESKNKNTTKQNVQLLKKITDLSKIIQIHLNSSDKSQDISESLLKIIQSLKITPTTPQLSKLNKLGLNLTEKDLSRFVKSEPHERKSFKIDTKQLKSFQINITKNLNQNQISFQNNPSYIIRNIFPVDQSGDENPKKENFLAFQGIFSQKKHRGKKVIYENFNIGVQCSEKMEEFSQQCEEYTIKKEVLAYRELCRQKDIEEQARRAAHYTLVKQQQQQALLQQQEQKRIEIANRERDLLEYHSRELQIRQQRIQSFYTTSLSVRVKSAKFANDSKFNDMMKNPYCIMKLGDYMVNTELDFNEIYQNFFTKFIGRFPESGKIILMDHGESIAVGEINLANTANQEIALINQEQEVGKISVFVNLRKGTQLKGRKKMVFHDFECDLYTKLKFCLNIDTYLKLTYERQEQLTTICKNGGNDKLKWDEQVIFDLSSQEEIKVKIMQKVNNEENQKDIELGIATLNLKDYVDNNKITLKFQSPRQNILIDSFKDFIFDYGRITFFYDTFQYSTIDGWPQSGKIWISPKEFSKKNIKANCLIRSGHKNFSTKNCNLKGKWKSVHFQFETNLEEDIEIQMFGKNSKFIGKGWILIEDINILKKGLYLIDIRNLGKIIGQLIIQAEFFTGEKSQIEMKILNEEKLQKKQEESRIIEEKRLIEEARIKEELRKKEEQLKIVSQEKENLRKQHEKELQLQKQKDDQETKLKEDKRLEEIARKNLEKILKLQEDERKEQIIKEENLLKAEIKAKQERIEADNQKKEQQRIIDEKKINEQNRILDETRIMEENKIQKELNREEEQRLKEENRKKDEKRKQDEQLQEEGKRIAEQDHIKEEQRVGKENRIKEVQRMKEEDSKKEEQRMKEEDVKKEEKRIKEENRKKEEQRLKEEQRIKKEQRIKEENRKKEEQRLKEEQRIKEKNRINEEQRMKEENRLKEEALIKEQNRLKKEAQIKEQNRLKEEALIKEQNHLKEEALIKEQNRLKNEALVKEHNRLKEEALIKEQNRLMEEAQLKQQKRQKEEAWNRSKQEALIKEQNRLKEEARIKEVNRVKKEQRIKEEKRLIEEARIKEELRKKEEQLKIEQQKQDKIAQDKIIKDKSITPEVKQAKIEEEKEMPVLKGTMKEEDKIEEVKTWIFSLTKVKLKKRIKKASVYLTFKISDAIKKTKLVENPKRIIKMEDILTFENVSSKDIRINFCNSLNNDEIIGTDTFILEDIKNLKSTSSLKLNLKGILIGDVFMKVTQK